MLHIIIYVLCACVSFCNSQWARDCLLQMSVYCYKIKYITHTTLHWVINIFHYKLLGIGFIIVSHKKYGPYLYFVLCTNFLNQELFLKVVVKFQLRSMKSSGSQWAGRYNVKSSYKWQMLPNCAEQFLELKCNFWLHVNCVSGTRIRD